MIGIFIREWAFVIALILVFGACGLGILAPLAANGRQLYFCAPLVGLLIVPAGANVLYVLLHTSLARSAMIAIVGCIGLTIWNLVRIRPKFDPRSAVFALGGLIGISILSVFTMDAATLRLNGPAILFIDGTDLGGYSHVADWLNSHRIDDWPAETSAKPYESWPALMFAVDPRFGAYSLLGFITHLHGTSAIFSYDVASAIILSAGTLGVAGIFSRSPGLAVLLAFGLFASHWFDYAHGGYFGKIIAYPATLFLYGLTWNSLRDTGLEKIAMLMIVAAALGTMHSGVATAFLIVPMFGVALLALTLYRNNDWPVSQAIYVCAFVSAIPFLASGVPSRLHAIGFPDYNLPWSYIVPRILDLENQGIALSGIGPTNLHIQVALAFAAWVVLLGFAIYCRNALATGLLGGAAILLIGISSANAGAVAFQLIGFFYPVVLCGALALVADSRAAGSIVLTIAVATILQRLPRFIGSTERYALHQSDANVFSQEEMDRLVKDVNSQVVQIDVDVRQPGILLLNEFGRRNVDVQWSARGWDTILHYRFWPLPSWSKQPTMTLRLVNGGGTRNHFALEQVPKQ